ncbi:MAG TPA: hypothetical protein DHU96_23475 [Actinobacteria bacterium]|nr:hypothetical protein [Actinomycetota bacterium]
MTTAAPGHDEITLTVPHGQHLCNDRQHRNLGRLAEVIVTFAQLGVPGTPREAFWPETWGRSYPMCGTCWEATRETAQKARPNLVIRDRIT